MMLSQNILDHNPKEVFFNLSLDDFMPGYDDFGFLINLVNKFPEIKIDLFTSTHSTHLPSAISHMSVNRKWCDSVFDLVELQGHGGQNFRLNLHGAFHTLPNQMPEFLNLTKSEALEKLNLCMETFTNTGLPFYKAFRPPMWQINSAVVRALEELEFDYLSDAPGYAHLYSDIKIPRVFSNVDIYSLAAETYVEPFKQYMFNPSTHYLMRGHCVSKCTNNLTKQNYQRIVNAIQRIGSGIKFVFLQELAIKPGINC